ncbi:MAG: Hsp33 family molecular chaperone [Pseudomonadota bacterium]
MINPGQPTTATSSPGTDTIAPAGTDAVVPFHVEALDARGRSVLLGDAIDAILRRHDYPEPVARLLGEMAVLTVLLGTSLKFKGKFIAQAQTDGPVSLLVVDFSTPDAMRAYARYNAEAVAAAVDAGKADPEDLLGKGVLALTVDQGNYMQRYQGVVSLDGTSLEEIARNYFRQSEQLPTEVRLAVGRLHTRDETGAVKATWRAGGLLAQFLPESEDRIRQRDLHPGDAPEGVELPDVDDDDAWEEVKALIGTIDDDELLDTDIGPHGLLYRLFHERGVRVYDTQQVRDVCSCSDEKLDQLLKSMSQDERDDAVENGRITVTCEFCSTVRVFNPDDYRTA